ncbi:MAG: hypothetical protein J6035_04155, partial [Bacteroidaceae bacterium]|nr:hypothetical protein [Bacteroidaceae bacterium]
MIKRVLVLACFVCVCLSARSQTDEERVVDLVGVGETLLHDSLKADSLHLTVPVDSLVTDTVRNRRYDYHNKKGILRPVYMLLDYLANTNKESDKPFDWSIAAGPSY